MEIDAIKIAITRKLYFTFGDSYEIYTEQVPQGFKEPCFFVQFLNLEEANRLGQQWRINTLFNVQYFGSNASNMTLQVQRALDMVELLNGQFMRSTAKNSEVVDGVAHNFMNFNFTLREVEAENFMESVEFAIRKGG